MSEEKKTQEESSEEDKKIEEKKSEDKQDEKETKVNKEENDVDACDPEKGDTCCGTENEGGSNVFVWIIVIVLIIGAIIFYVQKKDTGEGESKPVSEKVSEEVTAATLELVEGQLVAPGTEVTVGTITEESGLYKIELTVEGQEVTSYMTMDKTKFIPQLIDTKELESDETAEDSKQQAPVAEVTNKLDKPEVELFVMSYCPYGTQMEKGILPALEVLGDTVDAELKFVDYAMHGEKEIKENLRQYCIQEKEPQKANAYLKCFLTTTEGSDAEAQACMTQTQINQTLLNQCITATDAEYKVTELAQDKSTYISGQFPQFNVDKDDVEKYGVQGSPTLVINGEVVQSGRDASSILAAICSGFTEQPEACQTKLSSETPAPGFGIGKDTTGGASAEAGCGA
jgi:hypothetical protein